MGWHHLPLTESIAPASEMAAAYKARNQPGAQLVGAMAVGPSRVNVSLRLLKRRCIARGNNRI